MAKGLRSSGRIVGTDFGETPAEFGTDRTGRIMAKRQRRLDCACGLGSGGNTPDVLFDPDICASCVRICAQAAQDSPGVLVSVPPV